MADKSPEPLPASSRPTRLVPDRPWCLTHKPGVLELAYDGEAAASQYGALHLNDSYLRLISGRASGWGTSVVLLPVLWSGGQLYQGAPVACSPQVDGPDLILHLEGTIAGLHVTSEVRVSPPTADSLTAVVSTRLTGSVSLDTRPAEAFKLVMLSSMHLSPDIWDAKLASVEAQPFLLPAQGWVVEPPVVARQFSLRGGSSAWKRNAPTIAIELDRPATITGWVTPSTDPNDDNVALWAAVDAALPAWRYTVRAMRG